ncbi:helix-turn-helix transcriptional regulator [Streptomyces sp. PmtG]
MLNDDHPGARIAQHRKRARLTQRGLACKIGYSYSMVHQVEGGHKAASPDFTAACARALHVDVTALTGQPYMTELQQDRLAELIRPIRESLDLYDLGADPDVATRAAPRLVAAADALCEQVRAAEIHTVARTLPGLVTELTTAAYRTPATELWAALGQVAPHGHTSRLSSECPAIPTRAAGLGHIAATAKRAPPRGARQAYRSQCATLRTEREYAQSGSLCARTPGRTVTRTAPTPRPDAGASR